MPINPANSAMGDMMRSCRMAISRAVSSNPGAITWIIGPASSNSSIDRPTKINPTRVLMVSTKTAVSWRSRRATTLTMALWKGPLIPPNKISKKPGIM